MFYPIIVTTVVIRHYSWVGTLVSYHSSLEVCIMASGTEKLILREGTLRSVQAQGTLGTVSEVHDVFRNKDLPTTVSLWRVRRETVICI